MAVLQPLRSPALSALTKHPAPAGLQALSTASSTRHHGLSIPSPCHKGAVCMSPGCRHAVAHPQSAPPAARPGVLVLVLEQKHLGPRASASASASELTVTPARVSLSNWPTHRIPYQSGPLPAAGRFAQPNQAFLPQTSLRAGVLSEAASWCGVCDVAKASVRATRPRSVSESSTSRKLLPAPGCRRHDFRVP
ncbi:uncharacterized protein BDZ99DRAFT_108985 [Mytilinidion resinicola]|uniref:Uncharacterized protein n=1 Tax=Mytilinidion resinicola TaxID=574789 RepID=A0A6A6YAK4_9PEZI|nr:uncharacterized protein BDZ99DRAFT_108985 [Mytilinidion resinicola]KAF2805649.1 hypothetical protein BDZ99DRAFT_108985 [Mytilinidion resinicola]